MTCILYSLVTLTLYKFADIYILRHENTIDKHCLTSIFNRVQQFNAYCNMFSRLHALVHTDLSFLLLLAYRPCVD